MEVESAAKESSRMYEVRHRSTTKSSYVRMNFRGKKFVRAYELDNWGETYEIKFIHMNELKYI